MDVVYLDFQKAFDKMPHQRLLIKLKAYSIGESMISWIQAWLTDRRQRVIVEGRYIKLETSFEWSSTGVGVGTNIIFDIYNDLDDDLSSKVLKFADNTKVFRTIKTDADKDTLQDDLTKLLKWSEKWQMLLNSVNYK